MGVSRESVIPREEGNSPVNVDPKSTATMMSGLVLCSISAPYVYVGIKGIYQTSEMANFEKTESSKAGR